MVLFSVDTHDGHIHTVLFSVDTHDGHTHAQC